MADLSTRKSSSPDPARPANSGFPLLVRPHGQERQFAADPTLTLRQVFRLEGQQCRQACIAGCRLGVSDLPPEVLKRLGGVLFPLREALSGSANIGSPVSLSRPSSGMVLSARKYALPPLFSPGNRGNRRSTPGRSLPFSSGCDRTTKCGIRNSPSRFSGTSACRVRRQSGSSSSSRCDLASSCNAVSNISPPPWPSAGPVPRDRDDNRARRLSPSP